MVSLWIEKTPYVKGTRRRVWPLYVVYALTPLMTSPVMDAAVEMPKNSLVPSRPLKAYFESVYVLTLCIPQAPQ